MEYGVCKKKNVIEWNLSDSFIEADHANADDDNNCKARPIQPRIAEDECLQAFGSINKSSPRTCDHEHNSN